MNKDSNTQNNTRSVERWGHKFSVVAVYITLGSLALSTSVRSINGVAWLALLFVILIGAQKPFNDNTAISPDEIHHSIKNSLKILALFAALSFLIKAIPSLYWGENIFDNNLETRLALSSVLLLFLARAGFKNYLSTAQLLASLLIASFIASFHTANFFFFGSPTPYHIISWIGGIYFIYLISIIGIKSTNKYLKTISLIVFILTTLSILLSGVRAAYPLTILLLICIIAISVNKENYSRSIIISLILILFISFFLFLSGGASLVQNRISLATKEVSFSIKNFDSPDKYASTSVGARIYMWSKSIEVASNKPIFGVGKNEARQLPKKWGEEVNSSTVSRQRHIHSDYIQSFLNHGYFGIISYLLFILGMLLAAAMLLKYFKDYAIILTAFILGHSFMSFFNVNSNHNNYPTFMSFSLIVFYLLLLNNSRKMNSRAVTSKDEK